MANCAFNIPRSSSVAGLLRRMWAISSNEKPTSFTDKSLKELHQLLNEAVANENYELAAKIRDEISKR